MNQPTIRRERPMSLTESRVKSALSSLPPTYTTGYGGERINYGHNSLLSYEPDLTVRRQDGSVLVIEVKNSDALSLPNMVRFLEISSAIRSLEKSAFMVMIFGESDQKAKRLTARPEFSDLSVKFVSEDRDIISAVTEVFQNNLGFNLPLET